MKEYTIGLDWGSPEGDYTVFLCNIGRCKTEPGVGYRSLKELLTHVRTHFHTNPEQKTLGKMIRQAKESNL